MGAQGHHRIEARTVFQRHFEKDEVKPPLMDPSEPGVQPVDLLDVHSPGSGAKGPANELGIADVVFDEQDVERRRGTMDPWTSYLPRDAPPVSDIDIGVLVVRGPIGNEHEIPPPAVEWLWRQSRSVYSLKFELACARLQKYDHSAA
jgi:hypothetical protein